MYSKVHTVLLYQLSVLCFSSTLEFSPAESGLLLNDVNIWVEGFRYFEDRGRESFTDVWVIIPGHNCRKMGKKLRVGI